MIARDDVVNDFEDGLFERERLVEQIDPKLRELTLLAVLLGDVEGKTLRRDEHLDMMPLVSE